MFADHRLHLHVNDFLKNSSLWSDFDRIQGNKFFEDEGYFEIHSDLFQVCHEEDQIFSTIVTHQTHACSSIFSLVSKDYDSICDIEWDALKINFPHCNMIYISQDNVINFNLHVKRHNDVFDFQIIPKCHFALSHDDIALKDTFFIDSFSRILNHTSDKCLFSHGSHEKSISFRLDFYDPIYAWWEESFIKRFPCHPLCFVHTKFDLVCFLHFELFPFLMLILDLFSLAGLKLREWLHWKFSFT